MTAHRDLDDAIDRVAKRLTHVDVDAQFASRIVAALPERVTWLGWLTHSWAPRLATIAIVAAAAVLWNGRRATEAPAESRPLAGVAIVIEPSTLVASVKREPLAPIRTKPMERLEPVEQMERRADFERSLPAIASPLAIDVGSLTPDDLPAERALSVPALVIGDLPLTAESFSPRD